jgi:transposase
MRTYYVGMDVHQATIMIVVLNGAGKEIMELVVETGAETVRNFLKSLRGNVSVTFEEGTQAAWLHDVIRPLVSKVIVCDPRRNKLLLEGNKGDRIDALKLAQLQRAGLLREVYHGHNGVQALKELVRNYSCLVSDTTRTMNRLKAIFRGRAIRCAGQDIYNFAHRDKWLCKLKERGVKQRTRFLYEELAVLMPLRREAKKEMLKEARRHPAYQLLLSIPLFGPVRVAQLIAVVETPFRFRNKRQFWNYVGLAVVTRTSAEYRIVDGKQRKRSRPAATRGLNRNHNHLLKKIFKSAAMSACSQEPFEQEYKTRVKQGMDESLARLAIARKLAATTLAVWKRKESFEVKKMKAAA